MEKRSQVEIPLGTQKKNLLRPQLESNPWPSRSRLDALTTELWETRGEQGHILGSYMCDMCPAILQGSTCQNGVAASEGFFN